MNQDMRRGNGFLYRLLVASIFLLILILSLLWGRYPEPGFTRVSVLLKNSLAINLLWNIRIPRIILAITVGAALAGTGHTLQTVLGNPLVEPGLLGVSQGSAFGAALAILLTGPAYWAVPFSAAFFGLAGLGLSWFVARRIRYGGNILRLLLAGIVVSALFSSGLGILKYLADPRSQLPEITFWMMGGLSSTSWASVLRTTPIVIVVMAFISAARWRINLLALDDRSAFALGSNPGRDRIILVVLAVIAVAVVTAAAGIVSWVGLLVPHASRKLAGADTLHSLPLSMAAGGLFVLICDDLARGLFAGEIPLGLITALTGALLFGLLLMRKDRGLRS